MTPLLIFLTLAISLTPSLTYSAAPQTPAERAAKEIARVQAERRKKEDAKRAQEKEKRDKEEADKKAELEKERLAQEKAKQAHDAYKAAQYARAQWTKEQEDAEQRAVALAEKHKQARETGSLDIDEEGEEPINVEAIITQQLKEDKAKGTALQPASTAATASTISTPAANAAAAAAGPTQEQEKKSRVPSLQEMILQQHGAEMAQHIYDSFMKSDDFAKTLETLRKPFALDTPAINAGLAKKLISLAFNQLVVITKGKILQPVFAFSDTDSEDIQYDFNENGTYFAYVDSKGHLHLYDMTTNPPTLKFSVKVKYPSIAFSNNVLSYVDKDGTLCCYYLATGTTVPVDQHDTYQFVNSAKNILVSGISVTPGPTGSYTMRLFDTNTTPPTPIKLAEELQHSHSISELDPTGSFIAYGNTNGGSLYTIATGSIKQILNDNILNEIYASDDLIVDYHFNYQGTLIIIHSRNDKLYLYDITTLQCHHIPASKEEDNFHAESYTFNPQGTLIAALDEDHATINFFNAQTGQHTTIPNIVLTPIKDNSYFDVSFSPDGHFFAYNNNNILYFYDMTTYQLIAIRDHNDMTQSFEFSPQGTSLLYKTYKDTANPGNLELIGIPPSLTLEQLLFILGIYKVQHIHNHEQQLQYLQQLQKSGLLKTFDSTLAKIINDEIEHIQLYALPGTTLEEEAKNKKTTQEKVKSVQETSNEAVGTLTEQARKTKRERSRSPRGSDRDTKHKERKQ